MTKLENIIGNLKTFRELSSDHKKHPKLLKEKKIILYAATLLDNPDNQVVSLCLDVLENFVANDKAHAFLQSTFGIYEALETLSIRLRNQDEKLHGRAVEITEILRSTAPPAYNTRSKAKAYDPIKSHQLFLLYIEDLNEGNVTKLEHILLKIRGIISFLIDTDIKRCTVRICPKITVKEVIEKIYNNSSLTACVVIKNRQKGTEDYLDLLETSTTNRSCLEYQEEIYSPKGRAVTATAMNLVKNSNNILKSVVNLWNESFYW